MLNFCKLIRFLRRLSPIQRRKPQPQKSATNWRKRYAIANRKRLARHAKALAKAQRTIRQMRDTQGQYSRAQRLTYLRKIDWLAIEKMVLELLAERGCRIQHNERATGDGGSDGRFWLPDDSEFGGDLVHVQAKRWSGTIKATDVKRLRKLAKTERCKGLFVHTGRTPREAWAIGGSDVEIVSGGLLLDLVEGKAMAIFGVELLDIEVNHP